VLSGALRVDRTWGVALVGSILALIGAAPFAIFMSEYQLLRAAVGAGAWFVLVLFLAAGAVVFIAASRHLIDMAFGEPVASVARSRTRMSSAAIVATAMALLLLLGVWMPQFLSEAILHAAEAVGTRP
jgi:hydrogenase-4 component F